MKTKRRYSSTFMSAGKIKEGTFNMFEHLSAAFQEEETGHGNMGQLVQMRIPSMQKEFQTYFPDLNVLGSNFIRSVWRCDLFQTTCRRTFGSF